MKKFEIFEEKIVTGTIVYKWIVEAKNEDEALDIVLEGNIEPISITNRTETDVYDSEFEVTEIN